MDRRLQGRGLPYTPVLGQLEMMIPGGGVGVPSYLYVAAEDVVSGKRIPGARITVTGADGRWEKETDADGLAVFEFAFPPMAELNVLAEKEGYDGFSTGTTSGPSFAAVTVMDLAPRAGAVPRRALGVGVGAGAGVLYGVITGRADVAAVGAVGGAILGYLFSDLF